MFISMTHNLQNCPSLTQTVTMLEFSNLCFAVNDESSLQGPLRNHSRTGDVFSDFSPFITNLWTSVYIGHIHVLTSASRTISVQRRLGSPHHSCGNLSFLFLHHIRLFNQRSSCILCAHLRNDLVFALEAISMCSVTSSPASVLTTQNTHHDQHLASRDPCVWFGLEQLQAP